MNSLKLIGIGLCTLISVLHVQAQQERSFKDGSYVSYEAGKPVGRWITGSSVATAYQNRFTVKPGGAPAFEVSLRPLIQQSHKQEQPARLLVVSDMEGQFTGFRNLLLAAGVMDSAYQWTFGKDALVICGDLFDRGRQVTELLWLLYHLEAEAARQGGTVWIVLGNHDIMNLTGDYRYVDAKYLKTAKTLGKDYSELFNKDTELGRWLRSQPVIRQIGKRLYLHAGLSPELANLNWNISRINDTCTRYIDIPREAWPGTTRLLFGSLGPFWYRGYFTNPQLNSMDLDKILNQFGADQVVVGHTILENNIALYYEGKVLAVEVNHHACIHQAALLEKDIWYKVDNKGNKEPVKTF